MRNSPNEAKIQIQFSRHWNKDFFGGFLNKFAFNIFVKSRQFLKYETVWTYWPLFFGNSKRKAHCLKKVHQRLLKFFVVFKRQFYYEPQYANSQNISVGLIQILPIWKIYHSALWTQPNPEMGGVRICGFCCKLCLKSQEKWWKLMIFSQFFQNYIFQTYRYPHFPKL